MKTAVIVLLALVAIAGAQRSNEVTNNSSEVQVVDNNPTEVNVVNETVSWYPWPVDVTELNFTTVNNASENSTAVHVVDNNPSAVNVVDHNPSEVQVVDHNPSEVQVVDHNPSEVQVVDNNPSQVQFVDNNPTDGLNNPDGFVVDQAFYRPSNRPNGYEQISTGPALVDFGNNQNRPYPGKQYQNPLLRGGK